LLHVLVANPVFEPKEALIGTQSFAVYLDPGCSGWEGVVLFTAIFSFYLFACRKNLRFPHVLALLPLGVILLWCLNLMRIVALILLGSWSDSLGAYGFHSIAGWLLFNATTLGIVVASQHFVIFSKEPSLHRTQRTPNPALPYLMPLLAIITIGMLSRPFPPGLRGPLQVLGGLIVLWHYSRTTLLRFRWVPSLRAVLIGLAVGAVWLFTARHFSSVQTLGASIMQPAAPATVHAAMWTSVRALDALLIAPVVEELAFRGYLLRRLIAADFDTVAQGHFTWFSFMCSSIVFGLLHQQWYLGIFAGMAFAVTLYQRGRLSDAIVSHSVANGFLTVSALLTGNWLI
jgi:exosortase E/protease (VPEID-CTERM system)